MIQLHAVADRSPVESGALSVIVNYQRALPLLGLGCMLALVRPWLAALTAFLTALGVWLGLSNLGWLLAVIASHPTMASWIGLPGPIACVAVGLVLAASGRLRSWLLPPSAIIIGAMLAIGIKLVDPNSDDPNFLRGAIAASLWLIATVVSIARLCDRPWFRIAIRILGSWLIAIGLMLGTAVLLPRPRIDDALQLPPDRLEVPITPGGDRGASDADRSRSPLAPPGFDPLRQP